MVNCITHNDIFGGTISPFSGRTALIGRGCISACDIRIIDADGKFISCSSSVVAQDERLRNGVTMA